MVNDVVWLDVLPNMAGFGPAMAKGSTPAAAAAGAGAGKAFGLAAIAGIAAVAGGAVLAGKALYDVGATFDDMTDTIRVGTGATGDNLDKLVESAKLVGTQVPASFDDIGTAVADVNTRLGHTGKPLEEMSAQFLELSRITGTDVATNIEKVSRVFGDWGVSAEDQGGKLDYLFKVSQSTGIGMEDLSSKIVQYGAPFRQYGFSMEESAALMGKWAKEGVNTETVMGGMRAGLGKLSKAGKDPVVAFKEITEQIKNAGSAGEANKIAIETFGQRAGPDMAAAIREGRFELDDLMASLDASGETVMTAGGDTMDFSEQWTLFANKMSVLVGPAAEKIFGLVTDGMTWINENAIPWIDKMAKAWEDGTGPVGEARSVFDSVWAVLRDNVVPILGTLWTMFQDNVVPWIEKVSAVFRDTFAPILQDIWVIFNEQVLPILGDFWKFLNEKVAPTVAYVANNIILPLFTLIGQTIGFVWDSVIKPALSSMYDFLKNYVGPIFSWLWDKVVDPTFRNIGDAIGSFSENWKTIWNGLKAAAAAPVNFIIGTVWNNGLRKALNLIPGVNLGTAALISVPAASTGRGSTGGKTANSLFYSGGYTGPGAWNDPAGIVHAGEYVLTKREVDRAGGWQAIEELKHAMLPGYATGGRVTWKGKTFTDRFAATLAAAEARSRTSFNISQGGFRPKTSYSGTSHQADAVDIMSPITTSVITALRSAGVAAWDRTGKGNWAPHIHGVPLPGYGTAGGSAIWQAQDYLRGGDGLGGRDNGPRVGATDAGIFAIPGMIADVLKSIKTGLTGVWGDLMRGGMTGIVENVKDWALGKLNSWGDTIGDFIFGGAPARGYVGGTRNAQPGWAMLGERSPELITSPQMRYMHGGENVYSGFETRKLMNGGGNDHAPPTAEAIAEALIRVGFPEKVRAGVADGMQRRARSLQTEVLEG